MVCSSPGAKPGSARSVAGTAWCWPGPGGCLPPMGVAEQGRGPLDCEESGSNQLLGAPFPSLLSLLPLREPCWASQALVFLCASSGERGRMVPSAHGGGLSTSPTARARPTCPESQFLEARGGGLFPALTPALAGWPTAGPLPSCRLQLSPGISAQLTGGSHYCGKTGAGWVLPGRLFLGPPSWTMARPRQGPCHCSGGHPSHEGLHFAFSRPEGRGAGCP